MPNERVRYRLFQGEASDPPGRTANNN